MTFIKKSWGKVGLGLLVGLVVGSFGTAAVFAAIPDTAGVIHACYRSGGLLPSGQVRIIDSPGQSCNSNETALSWNSATPGQFLTNLVGADFSNADLRYRNFVNANLSNTTLFETTLIGSNFENANFSGATFSGSSVNKTIGANFKSANFTGAIFDSIQIAEADLTGVNLNNAIFRHDNLFLTDNLTGVNFSSVQFNDSVHINNSNLTNTIFRNLTLDSVNLSASVATNADFSSTHFINVDLTAANFSTAILTGTTWTNTVCPDGTNSDANGNTCLGHLVP